jgi:hypothetical protein
MAAGDKIERFLSKVITRENFESVGQMNQSFVSAMPIIIANLIVLFILLFIGMYLWNNYLTSLVTIVQPASSVVDILAIYVLFQLLF